MPYSLAYYKEAKKDITEAKLWYFNQQKGLEKRFADDVKNAILRLSANPYVHSIRHKNTRIAHPDIFPYSIHFYIEEQAKRIVIIGIVHNNRSLDFLKNRKF